MLKLFICLFAVIALCEEVSAQNSMGFASYESDILSARPVRFIFGIGAGSYLYSHGGSFSPSCNCNFGDESGFRAMVLGEFRIQYPKLGFAYGVSVTHHDADATFTREEMRPSVIVGDPADIEVQYRNTSNVLLQWIAVTPEFFWFLPRSELFFQVGMEFGFPLEARYDHVESILSEGIVYYDGSTEHVLLEEQDIPGGSELRLALSGSVGYDFWLAPSLALTPRVGISVPLSSVSSEDDDWRVLTGYAILMLNLRI